MNSNTLYECSVAQSCPTLCDSLCPTPMDCSLARLLCSWDFLGKNIGVGCHALLQEIFLTLGSILHLVCLLHWQAESSLLSHLGSPLKFTSEQLIIIKEINTHSHSHLRLCVAVNVVKETYAANGKWEGRQCCPGGADLQRPLEETTKRTCLN